MAETHDTGAASDDYRELFERSVDALLVVRVEDGRILLASNATRCVLDREPESLVGRPIEDLFPSDHPVSLDRVRSHDAVFSDQPFIRGGGGVALLDLSATIVSLRGKEALLLSIRESAERRAAEQERERLLRELQLRLEQVTQLSGLLPICCLCKRIRDDGGYWNAVETYIRGHSEAEFTHSICPECTEERYPDEPEL